MSRVARRQVLATGAALALAGCAPREEPAAFTSAWVGAQHARGHRLRDATPGAQPGTQAHAQTPGAPAVERRARVLVVGAGIAGLAAARAYTKAGVDDVQLLELEDSAGGNSRGHALAGMACPLGAHYLPLPGPEAREVAEWLHEIGLLKSELGRTVADERHLCHSPQARLFFEGEWHEGLLPPADPGSDTARQIRAFAQAVDTLARPAGAQARRAFALPAHRSHWSTEQQDLNTQTFAHWLDARGLSDPHLRWYLDYACRDDYGAGTDTVSAWAGVNYFASRHGFHAPGTTEVEAEREAVFTWPEGNAWLAQRLAAPFANGRLHTGRTVLRVTEQRHGVQVLAYDEQRTQLEAWNADTVVLALPLFVAARIVSAPPAALREAAALLKYAPWLVANLQLREPLLDRPGAPTSWDNVIYGSRALGYVDAMHQSLRTVPGATVLTAYQALPVNERPALLADSAAAWSQRVLADLATAHPDIHRRVQHVALMRWGHAMAIPQPGVQRHPALLALRAMRGRLRFAHADLAGYSVFEEAFTAGCEVTSAAIPAVPSRT